MARKKTVSVVATQCEGNLGDDEYHHYLDRLQARFLAHLTDGSLLFQTDVNDDDALWCAYLNSFPERERGYHNCHACREFLRHYGGLVTITEDGSTVSALWREEDAPDDHVAAVRAMARLVRRANVTGLFLSSPPVWGQPVTGTWRHFAVTPPPRLLYRRGILTANQAAAEKREDFKNVVTALTEFPLPLLAQALRVVQSDTLYRAEKVTGPAKWLHDLSAAWGAAKGKARANVVWRAVASAPAGFCHPRSSMIGTLLEDLKSGMNYSTVAARFKEKMHPLQYQRPTAAPNAGNIEQAEKIVAQLGIAASLRRRYARLDDVTALWLPRATEAPVTDGVFGHLKPKARNVVQPVALPAVTMTFDKFRRTVMPDAQRVELMVPHGRAAFIVLTTAIDPCAPNILQWDNPVAWYFWGSGSPASQFGLQAGCWRDVPALSLMPPHWRDESAFGHVAPGVVFYLSGARETRESGLGIFPENLRAELHGVRATIEAFSRAGKLEGSEDGSAVGIGCRKGQAWNVRLRVTVAGGTQEYTIDRWD